VVVYWIAVLVERGSGGGREDEGGIGILEEMERSLG